MTKVHFIQRNNKKKNLTSELHRATRSAFLLCRFIGLFPVEGLAHSTPNRMKYNIRSIYSLYHGGTLLLISLIICFNSHYLFFINEWTHRTIYDAIHTMGNTFRVVIIIKIARNWPELIQTTASIEALLPLSTNTNKNFRRKIYAIFITFVLLQRILINLHISKLSRMCHQSEKSSHMKAFFEYLAPFVFNYIEYRDWIAIMVLILTQEIEILEIIFDFILTFISAYLSRYFIDFNQRIVTTEDKSQLAWDVLRIQYMNMVRVVRLVNSEISSMVAISIASSLVTICWFIFYVLRQNPFTKVYRCVDEEMNQDIYIAIRLLLVSISLVFIITRTLIVTLSAAKLNSTSKEPALFLYELPEVAHSKDAQRLLLQINTTTVALSGLNFFYVTREMILSMTSVIITYELVLLQFSRGDDVTLQTTKMEDNDMFNYTSTSNYNSTPFII